MQKPVKIIIGGLVIIAILGSVPFMIRPYVEKVGLQSLEILAHEGGFCETDSCEEGVDYVVSFLETNYGLSKDEVKWCMGVDEIAHSEITFGNGIKNYVTDLMYNRCGNPILDIPQADQFDENESSDMPASG
ncbi:hypothetical protein ACLBWZ_12275 [Brucellaceae bacterium C25G]